MWIVHYFSNIIDCDDGKSALLIRYHHALIDGVNIMRLLLKYCNYHELFRNNSTDSPVTAPTKSVTKSPWKMLCSYPVWCFKTIFASHDAMNPLNNAPPLTETSPRLISFRTMDTTVTEIKMLKKDGFSVNDVLISCLTGAFSSYATKGFTEHAKNPIHGVMWGTINPLSFLYKPVEANEKVLGNGNLTYNMLPIPVNTQDPVERLVSIRGLIRDRFATAENIVVNHLMNLLGSIPRCFADPLFLGFAKCASLSLSTLPGPTLPFNISGNTVTKMAFSVPPIAGLHIFCTLLSYNDRVTVTTTVDGNLFTQASCDEILDTFNRDLKTIIQHYVKVTV